MSDQRDAIFRWPPQMAAILDAARAEGIEQGKREGWHDGFRDALDTDAYKRGLRAAITTIKAYDFQFCSEDDYQGLLAVLEQQEDAAP